MRPSRFIPRFTVRRLMIAVAIAGFCATCVHWRDLSEIYRRRAYHFAFMKQTDGNRYCFVGFDFESGRCDYCTAPETLNPPPTVRQLHYHRLEHKYRRAARYPWLHVEPDPPEPA